MIISSSPSSMERPRPLVAMSGEPERRNGVIQLLGTSRNIWTTGALLEDLLQHLDWSSSGSGSSELCSAERVMKRSFFLFIRAETACLSSILPAFWCCN